MPKHPREETTTLADLVERYGEYRLYHLGMIRGMRIPEVVTSQNAIGFETGRHGDKYHKRMVELGHAQHS